MRLFAFERRWIHRIAQAMLGDSNTNIPTQGLAVDQTFERIASASNIGARLAMRLALWCVAHYPYGGRRLLSQPVETQSRVLQAWLSSPHYLLREFALLIKIAVGFALYAETTDEHPVPLSHAPREPRR